MLLSLPFHFAHSLFTPFPVFVLACRLPLACLSSVAQAGISGEMETEICVGLGAATCNTAAEISMSAKVGGGLGVTSSDNQEKMSAQEQTFESSVTTSDDPNYVNGLGDLYLTVSGSLQVQTAYTVSGKIEKDEESGTQTCITTLKPSIAWQRDPSNTLTWSSGYDIEFVTIPLIEKQNRKLLAMYSVLDKAGLEAAKIAGKVPADAWRAYLDNEVAVAGWRAMLAYNQALKDASQPWPEFYQQSEHKRNLQSTQLTALRCGCLTSLFLPLLLSTLCVAWLLLPVPAARSPSLCWTRLTRQRLLMQASTSVRSTRRRLPAAAATARAAVMRLLAHSRRTASPPTVTSAQSRSSVAIRSSDSL